MQYLIIYHVYTQMFFKYIQNKKPPKKEHGKNTIRSVSSEVYSALFALLRGHTIPKKKRTPHIAAAYRIKMRKIASCAVVWNPLKEQQEDRVVIESDSSGESKILLQNHEVKPCLMAYYTKCKGVGARKLYNTITKVFCGVTEREIQTFLNSQQTSQQLHPNFINKQPLKPVTSHRVMDQIQMDIVDMQRSPAESMGSTYKYVLVVLDVFSRFIFLRPLQSKSSTEIATYVVQLFSDIGPPKIVQTDQGTEFKGVVEKVMDKFKIRVIHSRPYHPQSQGKVNNFTSCALCNEFS